MTVPHHYQLRPNVQSSPTLGPGSLVGERTDAKLTTRSRKIRLSSLHKRTYPKVKLQDSHSISALPTASSSDLLPDYISPPTSPKIHQKSFSLFSQPNRQSWLFWYSGIWNNSVFESRAFWIMLYLLLNFSLTLSNKIILNQYPFPYSITALHALAGYLGTRFLMHPRGNIPAKNTTVSPSADVKTSSTGLHAIPELSFPEIVVLVLFSVLYTVNIVVSNVSLRLVTVPFHQVVRSSTPFFILVLSSFFLNARPARQKLISLVPVVTGVGLATYGDYYYTTSGFILTLLGTFLAALKSVIINILQASPTWSKTFERPLNSHPYPNLSSTSSCEKTGSFVHSSPTTISFPSPSTLVSPSSPSSTSKTSDHTGYIAIPKLRLSPLQLLYLLSPLSFVQCMFLAIYFGEFEKLAIQFHTNGFNASTAVSAAYSKFGASGLLKLIINASLAFTLNMISFHTNRRIGPLGMSVTANIKQVLTVLSSVIIFNLKITPLNTLGVGLTLAGGAWYATMDLKE